MPFTYEFDYHGKEIIKATGSGEATFPSNVTTISGSAFKNTSVTSMIIPHTLTTVYIKDCPNLKSITMLNNNHFRTSSPVLEDCSITNCPNLEVIVLYNTALYFDCLKNGYGRNFKDCPKLKLYTEKEWEEHLERKNHYKLVQDMNVNLKQIQEKLEERLEKEKLEERIEKEKLEERLEQQQLRFQEILDRQHKESIARIQVLETMILKYIVDK